MPKNIPKEKEVNKIKYQTKLPQDSLTIFYAVSKDNARQTGDNFALFVNWAIENKKEIANLQIILSDYLNRFYVGEKKAREWGETWKQENTLHLNRLEQAGFSYQLLEWESLIKREKYSQLKEKIDELYRTDQEFITIVDGLAQSHKNKAGLKAAVYYVLEEATGIASLEEGILTYPAPKLNGAIHSALNKLQCGPSYIGHMFIYSKSKQDSRHVVRNAAFKFMCALAQTGYTDPTEQYSFFSCCIKSYTGKNKHDFSSFSETLGLQQHANVQSVLFRKDKEALNLFSNDKRRHSF